MTFKCNEIIFLFNKLFWWREYFGEEDEEMNAIELTGSISAVLRNVIWQDNRQINKTNTQWVSKQIRKKVRKKVDTFCVETNTIIKID